MGQRRPGPLDERRDAASLIALHPFVAGLATNAGSLAQDNEGLVLLQVPGDELHTFIHGVSLIPWHAAACRRLLPGLHRSFRLTDFSRRIACGALRLAD